MVEKETSLSKIQRFIENQKNIRNVATSAHIHHGKCISGDSRIMMADGSIRLAKDIFDEISKNGEIYEENEDHTVYTPKEKIEIFSLNKSEGKIEKKDIQYVWRLKGGNTIKIKLRNGFKITTTPEHKYIVFRDDLIDVEARDLRIGDRIVCSRKLDINCDMKIKREILNIFSQKNFYVKISNEFNLELKNKILSYGIKNIKTTIKPQSVYHGIIKNRYNISDFLEICRTLKIDLNDAYDKIDLIFYRTGKQRGHNASIMKLPKTDEEFRELFYLAGLFIGDGSGRKFIVGKEQLASILSSICHKFLIKTRRVERKDRTPEIHTDNLTLVQILNSLFDYPLKKKSHNVKISQFVWKSKNEYTSQLLKGYFDTDGCVEKSRRAITISSASQKMIEDLHLLLLRFGCISIKEKDNTITISGTSAINFEKEIGFEMKEKSEKLKNLVSKVSGSIVCDTIKVGNQVMLINKKIKDYSANELAYIEVKQIESTFDEVVYDFTIPHNHNLKV